MKVEDGFYSIKDVEILLKDDIFMLYFIKWIDKLVIEVVDYKSYFILINFLCKIEIFFRICEDRYYSVEDVVDVWIFDDFKFICVVYNGFF